MMGMPVATPQICSQCGASLARGICPSCALSDLLPDQALPDASTALEQRFGRYTLKERLAAGGMGVVYRAIDETLRRTVALKMIRGATFANEAERARFTIETEAAAALDHPHIIPVYEVGVLDEQPYFTMKLISGKSLAERLRGDSGRPSIHTLVKWIKAIAEAVHHAHERGVLHRDLKPGNVLIDASGKPWLTDFGLAKMVHQESDLTMSSDRLGTPHYMAPETIRDTAHAVSTTSDVWALGVMLWQCLTGELPFQADDPLEVMRLIGEQEPSCDKTVDHDLLTLAQRCLEKDPKRRVASAGLLAEELGRWLRREPLQVRPVSTGERLCKWAKRNPAWAALAVVFVLASLTSLHSWQRAERAVHSLTDTNSQLTQSLATATATQLAMHARLEVANNGPRALLLAAEAVDMSKRSTGKALPATAEALYQALQEIGGHDLTVSDHVRASSEDGYISRSPSREYPMVFSADQQKVLILDHEAQPDVVAAGYDLQTTPPRRLFRFPIWKREDLHRFQAVEWHPNGQQLVSADPQGEVRLWTAIDRKVPESQVLGNLSRPGEVLFRVWWFPHERAGRLKGVAFYTNEGDHTINTATFFTVTPEAATPFQLGRSQPLMDWEGLKGALWIAAPSRRWFYLQDLDRVCLVAMDPDKEAIEWETLPKEHSVNEAVAFSLDEHTMIHQTSHRAFRQVDLRSGSLSQAVTSSTPLFEHPVRIHAFAISAKGGQLAFADNRGEIFVKSLTEPTAPRWVATGEERWHRLRFSPDGRWLGAGGVSPTAFLWPISEETAMPIGKPTHYRGLNAPVLDIIFTRNAGGMIAYGAPARARHWSFEHGTHGSLPFYAHHSNEPINEIAVSPDKAWCLLACDAPLHAEWAPVKLVRLRDGQVQTIGYHHDQATACAFSQEGRWLASVGRDGIAFVWEVARLVSAMESGGGMPEPDYRFDTSAKRLEYARQLVFHPDGRLYVTCGDGVLFDWDLLAPDPMASERQHEMHSIQFLLPDAAVSQDGRWLAVARHGWDQPSVDQVQHGNMVLLYDASNPEELSFEAALPANFLHAADLAFSEDGRWLAANGAGNGATVWDLTAPDIVASRRVSPITDHLITSIDFSPDDRWLGFSGSDGRMHLWDWQQGDVRTISTDKVINTLVWLRSTQLLCGDGAGRLAQWETDVELLSRQARRDAGRELTDAERRRFRLAR